MTLRHIGNKLVKTFTINGISTFILIKPGILMDIGEKP